MSDFVSAAALRALLAPIFVCAIASAATAQALPAPWLAEDVGSPVLSGSTVFSSGAFSIDGAGTDITGTSDQFHFLYQAVIGDMELIARIDELSAINPWTIAGVMVRASLAADSAHALAAVTPGKGEYFRSRPSDGATTSQITGRSSGPPSWLRIIRQGSLIKGYSSRDGITWMSVGSATIAVGSTAYVGVAATSRHPRMRATALASHVSVTNIGLPQGQHSIDIGSPAVPGEVFAASGAYAITAAGAGIGGTADQFHFVYQPVTGSAEVIARVASISSTAPSARAGVTIRESLAAEARHATISLSAKEGYAVQTRFEPAMDTVLSSAGAGTFPGWVRLLRSGDLFEAYLSADGSTWTKIASETIPMAETVYIGLAATSYTVTAASTSIVDNFSITAIAEPVNEPPAVSIVSPAAGTPVTAPATMTVSALASDPEDRLQSVDFYADWTLISSVTTAPYAVLWSPSTAGTYVLTAVAQDADGGTTTSSSVTVEVQPRTNRPPAVSLSTNGASFTAPATIALAATASDPDGEIARVEFFAGNNRLSTVTTAPYSFQWSGVTPGTYSVTAVAYDNESASTSSATLLLTVNDTVDPTAVSPPRFVAFMPSTDHATNVTTYVIKVFASTAAPATSTPLATSDLGKPAPSATGEIVVDRTTFFSNLPAGSYLAVVTAVGPGGAAASESVGFTR